MNTNDGLRALIGDDIEKALEDSRVEGKTLGKYRIGSEIGKGGMGVVYEATDTTLGRPVVVKLVSFPSRDPNHCKMMVDRFRREAKAASAVMHPNLVVIFAFDEADGRHLLVMERIEGRTLRDELTTEDGRPRAMAPRKAVKIVREALKGIQAIHDAKIVHRDLKPGNVMLTHKDDQVKILDFGLGKASEAFGDPALDMTLTQQGMPIGSPLYMSPEQSRSLPVDGSTDIYAVGAMLFHMLTGKAPFRGKSAVDIYEQHRNAPVPPIILPGGVTCLPALAAVVRKAMAKAPGDRFASAAAMAAALEAIDFDPKPKLVMAKKPPPPARSILPLLAILAIVAVGAGVAMTLRSRAPSQRPETAVKSARGASDEPAKAVEPVKASGGIEIPPPPPAQATVAQGCELYTRGNTTDAIATLTRALTTSPDDPDGLYCLCGAYVRQPESVEDARKACKAYRAHPSRDAQKNRQVDLWLRRLAR